METENHQSMTEFKQAQPAAANPFGRKRHEAATTEELLANMNHQLAWANEAECGVLSCVLQDPTERLSDCRLTLPKVAFYHEANRTVYELFLEFQDKGLPLDPVLVTNMLRDRGLLERVGGPSAIMELFSFVPSPSHFVHYKKIVLDKWMLRKVIDACARGVADARTFGVEGDDDLDSMVSRVQARILDLTSKRDTKNIIYHRDLMPKVLDDVQRQMDNTGRILPERVPTGFTDIDRMTGGMQRGWMLVIAGRPSMGKSSLFENIYMNIATGDGHYKQWNHPAKWVIVVTLEMPALSLGRRSLVGGAGLNLQDIRYGFKSHNDQDKLMKRFGVIKDAKIIYIDAAGLSIQELRSSARMLANQIRANGEDLAMIGVDYLQLMKSDTERASKNRAIEIGEISRGGKEMAKELDVLVIMLSQLSRAAEETKDCKPKLSHLREGGDIEQDADIVALMHRVSYYDPEAPEDVGTVNIAKGRDVGIGEIDLGWNGATTRFTSLTDDLFSNNEEKRQEVKPKPHPAGGVDKSKWRKKGEFGPRGSGLNDVFSDADETELIP